jgi:ribokinase
MYDSVEVGREPIHWVGPVSGAEASESKSRQRVHVENTIDIVVIGSANMDLVLRVERLARAGETIAGGDLAMFPGGKGANQACAAGKLGGRVAMIGLVGNDAFGTELTASLDQAGVDTSHLGKSDRPTGCACIYVLPDGENSIVISPGANATVLPENVVPKLDLLHQGMYLLSQLEIPMATVEAALGAAKAAGVTTILDPAPVRPLSGELLRNVDFLTPNQSEAAALLGDPDLKIREFGEAEYVTERLLALGPAAAVLKLGSLGCYVAAGQMRAAVPGFEVKAVDTTAAGDVFNGAFAVALSEGEGVLKAARFANAAAAFSVTRAGAQSSIPSRGEVEAFLSRRCAVVL